MRCDAMGEWMDATWAANFILFASVCNRKAICRRQSDRWADLFFRKCLEGFLGYDNLGKQGGREWKWQSIGRGKKASKCKQEMGPWATDMEELRLTNKA